MGTQNQISGKPRSVAAEEMKIELANSSTSQHHGINDILLEAAEKIRRCEFFQDPDDSKPDRRKVSVEIGESGKPNHVLVVPLTNLSGNSVDVIMAGPGRSLDFSGMTVTFDQSGKTNISHTSGGDTPIENATTGLNAVATAARDWWASNKPTPGSKPPLEPVACGSPSF